MQMALVSDEIIWRHGVDPDEGFGVGIMDKRSNRYGNEHQSDQPEEWAQIAVSHGRGWKARGRSGLTNSSSATEAGEDRLNHEEEPAASLCSLERVVRPAPTERLVNVDRRPTGGGMRALPPGEGERSRRQPPKANRDCGTNGSGRALRTNGSGPAIGEPHARDSGPNELKLSDRHRRRKAWDAKRTGTPVPVRWSAWLGPRLQSGRPERGTTIPVTAGRTRAMEPPARAMTPEAGATKPPEPATDRPARATGPPARATKLPAHATESPEPATETPARATEAKARVGDDPLRLKTATQGLTNSSSATGTGEVKLDQQRRRERRCLFAGARG